MRVLAAAMAAVLVAPMTWSSAEAVDVQIAGYAFGCPTSDGEVRKPKFGDVGGIFFTNLPAEQKACLDTIDRMIYSCGINTTFISHDLNDRYPECLAVFEQQAERCARHFELQRKKCHAGDSSKPSARIAEQEVGSQQPEIEPTHLTMWAKKRSNIRSGPGTDYAKLGLLEIGDEVQVKAEIGDWLRIEAPGIGEAFVWAPLLTEEEPKRVFAAEAPGRLCDRDEYDGECWQEMTERPNCYLWYHKSFPTLAPISWSESCPGGIADGTGVLVTAGKHPFSLRNISYESTVTIRDGRPHGYIKGKNSDGGSYEGPAFRGKSHGRWIYYRADGSCERVLNYSEGQIIHYDEGCKEYPGCNAWNTRAFFRAATPSRVTECLRSGADPNARNQGNETPLHVAAVSTGNAVVVDILVKAGADPNARETWRGGTPLHMAAWSEENGAAVVGALMKAGADPSVENELGETPLDRAVYLGNKAAATALAKAVSGAGLQREFGIDPLHEAVLAEEAAAVSSLLKAGADPNVRDRQGATPLHWAASSDGSSAAVSALLSGGVDPNARDKNGESPLHWAAVNDNPAVFDALLTGGADPNARNKKDETPLHHAARRNGNPAVITRLVKAGSDLHARGKFGGTPLHQAVENWNKAVSILTALLDAGADPNAHEGGAKKGDTPLHKAAWRKDPAIVVALLRAGADPTARGSFGSTPLHDAAYNENPAIAAALLEAGADPNAKNDLGKTPLDEALEHDNRLAVHVLLKGGDGEAGSTANADLNAPDKDGNTSLHRAAESGTPNAVATLIEAGADPNARNDEGRTPLHEAASRNGNPAVAAALLRGGADPNARDDHGETPLHGAARWNGTPSVSDALLEGGADPNARDKRKRTPLHGAASRYTESAVVVSLIRAGGNPNLRDEDGYTPLHFAAWDDKPGTVADLIAPLLAAGADPNAQDKYGNTPLHNSVDNKDPGVAAALLAAGADPNTPDTYDDTPLHNAAANSEALAVVTALLEAGADPNVRFDDGNTPLHSAVGTANLAAVAALLAAGADPDIPGDFGETPMDLAQRENDPAVISALRQGKRRDETRTARAASGSTSPPTDRKGSNGSTGKAITGTKRDAIDATDCVKLHETRGEYWGICVAEGRGEVDCNDRGAKKIEWWEVISRSFENTCDKPVVVRMRHFAEYGTWGENQGDHGFVTDSIFLGNATTESTIAGHILLINNTHLGDIHLTDYEMQDYQKPPTEIAYCAEYVDMDLTPEYLYRAKDRMNSQVVDDLKRQGVNVGLELKTYYDGYISSLAHSHCYANVVREPPVDFEHFPQLDRYKIFRLGTWVEYVRLREAESGFHALSFDEESDFGGVSFHDVGGTDTHHISDLPKPISRD